MKMEAIAKETRLLCRNHIDTAQQLLSYTGSLETEMSALLEKRKELYSQSRSAKDEDTKSQGKAEPVSYTHLDVYKRQSYMLPCLQCNTMPQWSQR